MRIAEDGTCHRRKHGQCEQKIGITQHPVLLKSTLLGCLDLSFDTEFALSHPSKVKCNAHVRLQKQ